MVIFWAISWMKQSTLLPKMSKAEDGLIKLASASSVFPLWIFSCFFSSWSPYFVILYWLSRLFYSTFLIFLMVVSLRVLLLSVVFESIPLPYGLKTTFSLHGHSIKISKVLPRACLCSLAFDSDPFRFSWFVIQRRKEASVIAEAFNLPASAFRLTFRAHSHAHAMLML